MKKRQIIILSAMGLAIMAIATAIGKNKKGEEKEKESQDAGAVYVHTDIARVEDHNLVISGNGRLGSSRNVTLIAEVQGELLPGEVSLKNGSSFKKGQFLFGIKDREARLKMQARKSGFLTMLATALPDLKIDFPDTFERWEKFFESIDVTKPLPELPKIESMKGKTFLASKNILGEYYSIQADEELLSKYHVYAPFDGNFIEVMTELGTVVNTGSQIAKIIQTGDLEIEVPVSVGEAHYLDVGQRVRIYAEGDTSAISGQISRIGQYVNPNTQSVDIFISITDKNARLFDGMYVEVDMDAGVLKDVVKIPRSAMIDDKHIFIVKDSIIVRQSVNTLLKSEGESYVTGINHGVQMVVEPMSNPIDSMIVKTIPIDEEGR